eukprot:TRINITY_DN2527_c0_g1_i1.p6 TRINITY_DN2527_c0_g1~~TRINITY_DN2527_c0_g1_i1.p6  ORF type:complete len:314 (-),score=67.33 TRINITY_DN2527_c0_g1_i1:2141-3082(-)
MLDSEDFYEELATFTTTNAVSSLFQSLSDQDPFPEPVRRSLLERYETKNGPTQFESKLAAVSEVALQTFQGENLGSAFKRHFTKLEMEQKEAKDKPLKSIPKRIKQDTAEFSLEELISTSKKVYYAIEKEKMKPKEVDVEIKKEIAKDSPKKAFMEDAVMRKYKIEEEKARSINLEQKAVKRKRQEMLQGEEGTENTKRTKKGQLEESKVVTLTEGMVIRKSRIEREREEMIKEKGGKVVETRHMAKENRDENAKSVAKKVGGKVSGVSQQTFKMGTKVNYTRVKAKINTGLGMKSKKQYVAFLVLKGDNQQQ